MRALQEFLIHRSTEDLLILGFFITLASTITGYAVDLVMENHGFGVIGNTILIVMGSVVGAFAAETQGVLPSVLEANRVVMFSTLATSVLLVICLAIKSRMKIT
jgi:uncharacterized membrane protein YeaQ/YmgE (transglycosylase-associated protein family)